MLIAGGLLTVFMWLDNLSGNILFLYYMCMLKQVCYYEVATIMYPSFGETSHELIFYPLQINQNQLMVAQTINMNLPAMQETQVQSLGQEGPLEKGMATHSSIIAWRIPGTEELSGLQSMGSERVGHNWVTNTFTFHFFLSCRTYYYTKSFEKELWSVINGP